MISSCHREWCDSVPILMPSQLALLFMALAEQLNLQCNLFLMLDSLNYFLGTSASFHTNLLGCQEFGEFLMTVKQTHY